MAARRAGSRARQRRRDERLLALDEKQGRDQPAHAVAEEQARRIAMVDLDQSQQFGHAVEKGRKARDITALAIRSAMPPMIDGRSDERRVGKEWDSTCKSRWSPYP